MFNSLRKKLTSGLKKFTQDVAEKSPEPTFEREEQFLHEREVSVEEVLKEEPEKIEQEKEQEEHFDAQPVPENPEPELGKETLAERLPQRPAATLEDRILKKEERLEKRGFLQKMKRLPGKVKEKTIAPADIDSFFSGIEADLLSSNVAVEVIDSFKKSLKQQLAGQTIRRGMTEKILRAAFEQALLEIVDQGSVDLNALPRPATLVFLGFNGSGKTTSIAKVARYLQKKKRTLVLAAGDTFRSAAIEQLEHHGKKLSLQTIKHAYGGDPAAVIFDAKKHAAAAGLDFVLADTAGRTHMNTNLMDELKKIIRVNSPELSVLVIDSLTGNDAVEQARLFDKAVGVDAVILTKVDVNTKGGSLLSVAWAIKKPVLFLGTGQRYDDLVPFEPAAFVKELLG